MASSLGGELGLNRIGLGRTQKATCTPLTATQANGADDSRAESRHETVVARDGQWEHWMAQREALRGEIKRGRECLDETEHELASLQARPEEWPSYERICGRNPLQNYMELLAGKERIARFLPGWLKRREEQLHALSTQLKNRSTQPPIALASPPAAGSPGTRRTK